MLIRLLLLGGRIIMLMGLCCAPGGDAGGELAMAQGVLASSLRQNVVDFLVRVSSTVLGISTAFAPKRKFSRRLLMAATCVRWS